MAKKKQQGHYCKICGERKANEKFTGRGHAVHICKVCQSLPTEVQADMRRIGDVERVAFKYPLSRQDWELLEKYAKRFADKESGQFAQSILDDRRAQTVHDENEREECEEQSYTEFEDDTQFEIKEWLREILFDYICRHEREPDDKYRKKIIERLNRDTIEVFMVRVKQDEAFTTLWREIVQEVQTDIAEMDEEE